MKSDVYKTIEKFSEGIFKDKGSRFIAQAYPVSTEDEIKEILARIKKQFYDATHHCYAYKLGYDDTSWRVNDDGEPSGSAGRPIYGQIQSNELTNILVIVIRYYGGVKLGVSGLINAYKTAASEAISNNSIIEKTIDFTLDIFFDYNNMNQVMKIIKDEGLKQSHHSFDMQCNIKVVVRKRDVDAVIDQFSKINNVTVKQIN